MTDIIITAQNPKHGDMHQIRNDFWYAGETCLFRGQPLPNVEMGDNVYFQHGGKLWGFANFDRYDSIEGNNLQGEFVDKPNAMFLIPPMHRFDTPVDLRGVTHNHGARYLDPTKYSKETMDDLREQMEITKTRPGWFLPNRDNRDQDPDPFPEAIRRVVCARIEGEDYRIGTRKEVIAFIKDNILPFRKEVSTYKAVALSVDMKDWDEAIILTLCLLTDDGDQTWDHMPIIRNGVYLYYNGAQLFDVGSKMPSWRRDWIPARDENGKLILYDIFPLLSRERVEEIDKMGKAELSKCRLMSSAVGDTIVVTKAGYFFDIKPPAKKTAKNTKPEKAVVAKAPKGKAIKTKPRTGSK